MSFLGLGIEAVEEAAVAAEDAGRVAEDVGRDAEDAGYAAGTTAHRAQEVQVEPVELRYVKEIGVQVSGFDEARAMLQGIAGRMRNPGAALAAEVPVLEAAERQRFAELDGKEVDTGRLKRSLTESGSPDAVRQVTESELVFGTSVPYARYQRNRVLVDGDEASPAQRVLDRIVNG